MNAKSWFWIIPTCLVFLLNALAGAAELPAAPANATYRDPKVPIDERVDDLLARMTLDEKIGQLMMGCGGGSMGARTETLTNDADIKELARKDAGSYLAEIQQGRIGTILQVMTLKDANAIQRVAQQSRLGIPVLIATDAIHGAGWTDEDTAIFPASLGVASSFDPAIAEAIGRASAIEARATGARWIFAPNIDVARDPRWGRMGETFGEDVLLVSDMGEAFVRGMQAPTPEGWFTVAACAKHLAGGGQPVNGINNAPFALNEIELRTNFLPPFERCVRAGILSIMAAHNETLGVPCHSSRFLLDQVLRREWGFRGMVVSDWGDVDGLMSKHSSVANLNEAVAVSLGAGVDVYMLGQHYGQAMRAEIQAGRLDPKLIDQAVRRFIKIKFQVGLFDQPYTDLAKMKEILHSAAHRQLALDAARKGIVLLKNQDALLPLEQPRKILVTGPNAANAAILGDWALGRFEPGAISVLRGMREQAPAGTTIAYADTGDLYSITNASIAGAAKAAQDCDVVVAVVGEVSLRSWGKRMTCGENHDRSRLNLFGRQDDLLRALYATGKPVVVVLVNGRALCIEEHVAKAAALVEAWEPGEAGGQAIAEILYGKVNPSGRLPVTIPRHEGQLPIFYNHKKANFQVRNANENGDPLYWFGAGLSYTTFRYTNIQVPARLAAHQPLKITVTVANTGKRAGDEVVLVYCRDLVRSTVPPVKELKGYARISLQPGEAKEVSVEIPFDRFASWNPELKKAVEAGQFEILIGSGKAGFTVDQTVDVK
jgi:beta-glucosidase